MAGLLDIFGTGGTDTLGLLGMSADDIQRQRDDAQAQALYALAANLFKGGPTGQSIAEGLAQGQQAYKGAMKSSLDDQLTMYKLKEADAAKKRAAGAQMALQQALQPKVGLYSTVGTEYGPDNRDIGGGWSPAGITSQAPEAIGAVSVQPSMQDLIQQFSKYGSEGLDALKTYIDVKNSAQPKYISVKEGEQLLDPNTLKPIAGLPKQNLTNDYKNWQLAGSPGEFGTWLKTHNKQTIIMNEGQQGFKNEMDLMKQFSAEPIYKELAGMDTAYKQLTAAIKSGTPIGDTAAATKIMKLLDPGSVVRESELALAMAASGKLDRLTNYMNMYIKGTKLTDTQRAEFQSLADELYNAAATAYNSKRDQYTTMANKYKLNTDIALGKPAQIISNLPSGVTVTRKPK